MARTCEKRRISHRGRAAVYFRGYTLYFSRSSLLRGADIMVRLTDEGALKWALRDFLREE